MIVATGRRYGCTTFVYLFSEPLLLQLSSHNGPRFKNSIASYRPRLFSDRILGSQETMQSNGVSL